MKSGARYTKKEVRRLKDTREENLEHVTKVECEHTDDPLWYDFPWSPHSVQRVFLEVLTFLGWSRLVGQFRFRESMPQPPNDYSDRPLGRPFFWGIYPCTFRGLAKRTSVGSDWIKCHTFTRWMAMKQGFTTTAAGTHMHHVHIYANICNM